MLGRVGERGQRGGRRDHAVIVVGGVGTVALGVVARAQAPAGGAVALEAMRVAQAMRPVDQRMALVLLPVVGIAVAQAARVQAHEGIVREEQWPAPVAAERQGDAVEGPAVPERPSPRPALMVGLGVDRVARRGRREHIGDQRLVPAADLVIHGPAVVGAPMPVEHGAAAAGVPVPFDRLPDPVDALAQLPFRGVALAEVLPGAQQAGDQEGGLDQIAAVVLRAERDRPARLAMQEVREDAMVAVGGREEAQDLQQALGRLRPRDPAPLDRDDDRHDAEARAAGRHDLGAVAERGRAALAGKPADRVREIPEVAEGLPLHEVEQEVVGEVWQRVSHRYRHSGARRRCQPPARGGRSRGDRRRSARARAPWPRHPAGAAGTRGGP